MPTTLDTESIKTIADTFETLSVPAEVQPDGSVQLDPHSRDTLEMLLSFVAGVREILDGQCPHQANPHKAAGSVAARRLLEQRGVVLIGNSAAIPRDAVLDIIIGLDSAARLQAIYQEQGLNSDTVDEIEFYLDAAARHDIANLGEYVQTVASALE